ncbi:MAG: zinc ribbon domain-containing protein [Cyanobacteria bacterium J06621_11]
MFSRLRRSVGRFFNKSRKINHEPINKVSLVVIVLLDIFVLSSVFAGLQDISQWPLSPSQTYPCQQEWQQYRESDAANKDYEVISQNLRFPEDGFGYIPTYRSRSEGHLGEVSNVCLQYESTRDALSTSASKTIDKSINDTLAEINSFKAKNRNIRSQYDSTLLEEIAGQPREQSINEVGAAEARKEIEQNEQAIAQREPKLKTLQETLVATAESQAFLSLLNDGDKFSQVNEGFEQASFWYPSIQLVFQALFLLPLILLAAAIHWLAERRNYGYIALISWHLLVVFCIPLIWKLFEFFQFGFIIQWLTEFLEVLFGGLRFLVNYLQILLFPIIGFAIIKFAQRFVFNTRRQAANRIQKGRCVNCGKKIRKYDVHCPHCSYQQYQECHNCHNLTYRHLPHCKHCGAQQPLDLK